MTTAKSAAKPEQAQTRRPRCEQPFIAGDPGRHEAWFRARGRCRNLATWAVSADVVRVVGRAYRSRRIERTTITVYGCGAHPLARPDRLDWRPTRGIWARPLPGYALPQALRALARAPRAQERSAA